MAKDKDYQRGTVEYERGLLTDSIMRIVREKDPQETNERPFLGSPRSKGKRKRKE